MTRQGSVLAPWHGGIAFVLPSGTSVVLPFAIGAEGLRLASLWPPIMPGLRVDVPKGYVAQPTINALYGETAT